MRISGFNYTYCNCWQRGIAYYKSTYSRVTAKQNAKYTSKTIQNQVIHVYACKIREGVTKQLQENHFPFTMLNNYY